MSTVLEVIAAVHAGMRVLGLSAITNAATGGPDQRPDTIEAVLAEAGRAGRTIERLLARLLPEL
jgi:purine-nucleoside phosphorylase